MADTNGLLNLLACCGGGSGGRDEIRNELINHAQERLKRLAKKMLREDYPDVRRFEETADVLQEGLLRLNKALQEVTVQSKRHFWNLAALQLRRTLIDMARHHMGPRGHGAKHHTDAAGKAPDDPDGPLHGAGDGASEPTSLETWARFHEQIESLPEREREVIHLIWYWGLTQKAAADSLGITEDVVRKRWTAARLRLHKALGSELPE